MRIIGEQRFASRGEFSADDPVIACIAILRIQADARERAFRRRFVEGKRIERL